MADPTAQTPSDSLQPAPSAGSAMDVSSIEAILEEVSRDAPQVLAAALDSPEGTGPEIESLLRDIGALTQDVHVAVRPPDFDIEALHADIERALADAEAAKSSPKANAPTLEKPNTPPPPPPAPVVVTPVSRPQAPRVDPLIAEIDAALADDADSLIARADGDVKNAVASVFDEGTLAGLDEEINRALIEAFGTSRLESPTYLADPNARISNPVGKFDGIAKQLPPETELDIVRATAAAPPASATAAPAVSTEAVLPHDAPVQTPSVEARIIAEQSVSEPQPVLEVSTPAHAAPTATARAVAQEPARVTLESPVASPAQELALAKPARTPSKLLASITAMLLMPVRMLTQEPVQQILAALALATFLAVPIAWYSAWRQSQAPAVGRVSEEVLPLSTTPDAPAEATATPSAEAHAPPAAHH